MCSWGIRGALRPLAYRVCYKHRREKLAKGLDRLVAAQQERPGHALQTGAHIWHVVQHARIFQKFFSPIVFTDSKGQGAPVGRGHRTPFC